MKKYSPAEYGQHLFLLNDNHIDTKFIVFCDYSFPTHPSSTSKATGVRHQVSYLIGINNIFIRGRIHFQNYLYGIIKHV